MKVCVGREVHAEHKLLKPNRAHPPQKTPNTHLAFNGQHVILHFQLDILAAQTTGHTELDDIRIRVLTEVHTSIVGTRAEAARAGWSSLEHGGGHARVLCDGATARRVEGVCECVRVCGCVCSAVVQLFALSSLCAC